MNKQSAAKKIFCLLTAMLVASVAGAGEYPGAHVTSPGQYAVLLENEEVLVLKMVLEPGESDVMHSHHNEQITYVLEGALRFLLGEDQDEEVIVRSGEVLTIPPNLPHSAEALEDTLDVDVFNPPRQDWLDGTDAYLRR